MIFISNLGKSVSGETKKMQVDSIKLSDGREMRDIDENGYMYLGIAETDKIREKLTKEKFIIEYL